MMEWIEVERYQAEGEAVTTTLEWADPDDPKVFSGWRVFVKWDGCCELHSIPVDLTEEIDQVHICGLRSMIDKLEQLIELGKRTFNNPEWGEQ